MKIQFVTMRRPLYLDGANSLNMSGAMSDAAPTPQPSTNRPTIMVHTVFAASWMMVPKMNTTLEAKRTRFRPTKFAATPPTIAPRSAPSDVADVIKDLSPDVRILFSKSVPTWTKALEM